MTRPDRLLDQLDDWLGDGPSEADPATAPAVLARVRATPQRPGWLARGVGAQGILSRSLAAAVIVVVCLVVAAALLVPSRDRHRALTAASPMATVQPNTSSVPTEPSSLAGHALTRIAITAPHSIGVGAGSIWVGTRGATPAVLRIDPGSSEVIATVDVGGAAACGQISEAFGAIWSPHCGPGGLKRIDPTTERVTATVMPDLGLGVAVLDDAVWTAPTTGDGDLARIEPDTGRVLGRLHRSELGWWSVAASPDSLWVTSGDTLERVDPVTGEVLAQVVLGGALWFPIAADGSLWVAQEGGPLVFRVDPASASLLATIDMGSYVTGGFAVDDTGGIWAATRAGLVSIDPATDTVAERLEAPGGGGDYVAAGFGALWLTSEWRDEVWRIEP